MDDEDCDQESVMKYFLNVSILNSMKATQRQDSLYAS